MDMPHADCLKLEVYFNPKCSKSRAARDLLDARGVDYQLIHYLDAAPDRAALQRILKCIDAEDPRAITRSKEALYAELELANADYDTLLTAITEHPQLLERPIVLGPNRGVVARPPERLLDLLETE